MRTQLFEYQNTIVNRTFVDLVEGTVPVVLAASPGAGKTVMSIKIIEYYLERNPSAKILVLTHGTRVLREQYLDRVQSEAPAFTFKMLQRADEIGTEQVTIALPHAFMKAIQWPKYDLIVVDEAHQFYFAEKLVKNIVRHTKPSHQLLLTGSPSVFIRENNKATFDKAALPFVINTVTMGEILQSGTDNLTDFEVDLAQSSYSITNEDYVDDEVRSTFKYTKKETQSTLNNIIEVLIKRLTVKNLPNASETMNHTINNSAPSYLFGEMKKTMIACRSQKQAMDINNLLNSMQVNSVLSTSDTDTDSENIDKFQTDDEIKVLVVVYRGILGFDYKELTNVIDLSGSRNIDRIFQLLSRVVRKHPDGRKKLFIKVASEMLSGYTKHLMTAVLSLTQKPWYDNFDGKNFLSLPLPVKQKEQKERKAGTKAKSKTETRPIEYLGVPVIELFNDVFHEDGGKLNLFAWTTLGKVREEFLGVRQGDPEGNKEALIKFIIEHGRRPNLQHEEERKLFNSLYNYIHTRSSSYDSSFAFKINTLCPPITRAERLKKLSFKRMLKEIPDNVSFKEEQEWKGTAQKHVFVDIEYGEFKASPASLLSSAWPNGLTGHPIRGQARSQAANKTKAKVFKCSNGKIYNSLREASKELGIQSGNISKVLKGRCKSAKGLTFEYVEDTDEV